jgi:hypothetical protein
MFYKVNIILSLDAHLFIPALVRFEGWGKSLKLSIGNEISDFGVGRYYMTIVNLRETVQPVSENYSKSAQ